jgi:L-threonylcarbamoyladenylate synthase
MLVRTMLRTRVVKIDPENIDFEKITQAAEVIKKGGIVAFPTETVYGLAADYANKQAVDRVFVVKKRPKQKPLTVQIRDITDLEKLGCDVSAFAYQLMSKFWPGPLTLVLPARPFTPTLSPEGRGKKDKLIGGASKQGRTIGVRIPENKIARSLIELSQRPLVVPSANLSGKPAAQTAQEVLQIFNGLIEFVIDGGKAQLGIASTVVDLSVSPLKVLREGAIAQKDIYSV